MWLSIHLTEHMGFEGVDKQLLGSLHVLLHINCFRRKRMAQCRCVLRSSVHDAEFRAWWLFQHVFYGNNLSRRGKCAILCLSPFDQEVVHFFPLGLVIRDMPAIGNGLHLRQLHILPKSTQQKQQSILPMISEYPSSIQQSSLHFFALPSPCGRKTCSNCLRSPLLHFTRYR